MLPVRSPIAEQRLPHIRPRPPIHLHTIQQTFGVSGGGHIRRACAAPPSARPHPSSWALGGSHSEPGPCAVRSQGPGPTSKASAKD